MPTKHELEKESLTELALLCQKVADNPSNYTQAAADSAFALKKEWVSLQSKPDPNLKRQQEKEAQLASLKTRMAEFLAGVL